MNKKLFLGAILLGAMTVSTGALTSCIDNDEPEGITNLRGAKAELLRAKAALELAKVETEKQTANLVAAEAAVQQAIAKQQEAIAKQEEAIAKQEEAKVAYEEAVSEEKKAQALKELAAAQRAQAEAETHIAKIKAQLEVELLGLKTSLLDAQKNYDNLVAEIEAAKAVLTYEQAQKLAALQTAVDTAWDTYKSKESAVLTAMENLFNATNTEEDNIEGLQKAVVDAKADLVAINAAYDELKALAEEATPTAWEARMDSLKNYSNKTADLEKAELQLKKDEIKQSAEYKAAEKEDKAARMAYIAAQQNYNYLADAYLTDCFDATGEHAGDPAITDIWGYYTDGTHPSTNPYTGAKKYDLQGATIKINNPEAFNKIAAAIDPAYASSLVADWRGQLFEVNGTVAAWGGGYKYSELFNAFGAAQPWNPLGNPSIAQTVAAWEAALKKVKVTDEEIAGDSCVANYEKAVALADSTHKVAVAAWEKAHKTYAEQKVETSVSTATIKAAIKKYNDNVDALVAAVTAYNTAYDAAFTSLKAQYIEKQKIVFATTQIDAVLAASPSVGGTVGSRTSLAQIDALIESSTLTAAEKTQKKTDYKTAMNNQWNTKTVAEINAVNTAAETNASTNAASEDNVTKAWEKISKADNSGILNKITATDGGWNATKKEYTGSYATIDKAVADFIVAAGKNSEKQTTAAATASSTAKQEAYTGVADASAKKYIALGGTKAAPNYVAVTTGMWVEDEHVLNSSDVYVKNGHKVVVRTKVSDEAIAAMTAVELDKQKAAENWVEYSAAAFGTSVPATITIDGTGRVTSATNARHTELTAGLINWSSFPPMDENGETLTAWTGSTLAALIYAQNTLNDHNNLQGVNEEIESLKKQVADAKAAILEQIAGYTAAVNEAYAAIEPAKKEHQAKHNAAYALIADVDAAIKAINGKIAEYNTIANDLQDILNAYYNTVEFVYTDENGNDVQLSFTTPSDFSQVKSWLKAELAKYEKNNPLVSPSEGKIKDAEAALARAEKALERGTADDEFDTVAQKKLELEQAQAELEVAKSRYEFALSQLNDYVAALSK